MDNDYLDDISSDEDLGLLNPNSNILTESNKNIDHSINKLVQSAEKNEKQEKSIKYSNIEDVASAISSDEDTFDKPQNGML